jgi:uncharacterized membrane protein (DUF4010 family)
MLADLDLATARDFGTALLLGALLGIEREKRNEREGGGAMGLRSFVLLAMLGAIGGHLATAGGFPWMLPAVIVVAGALVLAGYFTNVRVHPEQIGLTSELAAVATCLLGALVTSGHREIAVVLGVAAAALLVYKQPLHQLVGRLAWDDVLVGMRLLLATFIVLPLLPNHALDPWGAFNPYKLWVLVLLISGLSLVGYVATRLLGSGRGIAVTAVAGGLVSSTATTLAMSKQSREPGAVPAQLVAGILIGWAIMCVRVVVVAAVIAPALLVQLAPGMTAMAAVCAAVSWWSLRTHQPMGDGAVAVPVKNPFSLLAASKLAAVFAAVQLMLKLSESYAPRGGEYVIAALAGLTDVDAITVAMSGRADTVHGDAGLAAIAIVIACCSNTVVKAAMAAGIGQGLRRHVLLAAAAMIAAGLVAVLLL